MQGADTDRVKVDDHSWVVECLQCGRRFEATRSDATTCSQRCRTLLSRAPERRRKELAELTSMARRASAIAHQHSGSQQFLDQMTALYKSIGKTLDVFEVEWKPQALPLDDGS